MKCLKATNALLKNRRGELLIESVLAVALLAILFAAVLLMITASIGMVNGAVEQSRTQQAAVNSAIRQDFLTDAGSQNVTFTFTFGTPSQVMGSGGTTGKLTDSSGYIAFAGG